MGILNNLIAELHIIFLFVVFFSIIATPGRFMHVAVEMDLKLKSVQYVVFDEADRLV